MEQKRQGSRCAESVVESHWWALAQTGAARSGPPGSRVHKEDCFLQLLCLLFGPSAALALWNDLGAPQCLMCAVGLCH